MSDLYLFSIDLEDVRFQMADGRRFAERVPVNTRRYLAWLKDKGFRCTFFAAGDVAEAYPDLIREILDAGHEVGCHTSRHVPLDRQTPATFRDDLAANVDAAAAGRGEGRPRLPGAHLLPDAGHGLGLRRPPRARIRLLELGPPGEKSVLRLAGVRNGPEAHGRGLGAADDRRPLRDVRRPARGRRLFPRAAAAVRRARRAQGRAARAGRSSATPTPTTSTGSRSGSCTPTSTTAASTIS